MKLPYLELLKEPYLFKCLHEMFGIDFEKQFYIKKLNFPCTFSKIIKDNKEHITDDTLNIVLLRNKKQSYRYNQPYNVILLKDEKNYKIDLRQLLPKQQKSYVGVDLFYIKRDVENIRKAKETTGYLITVNKKLLHTPYNTRVEHLSKSFLYGEMPYERAICSTENHNAIEVYSSYSDVGKDSKQFRGYRTITLRDNNNSPFGFDIANRGYSLCDKYKQYDIIDKSGYNLYDKREILSKKLYTIQQAKEVTNIIKFPFEKHLREIGERIDDLRLLMSKYMLMGDIKFNSNNVENTMRTIESLCVFTKSSTGFLIIEIMSTYNRILRLYKLVKDVNNTKSANILVGNGTSTKTIKKDIDSLHDLITKATKTIEKTNNAFGERYTYLS